MNDEIIIDEDEARINRNQVVRDGFITHLTPDGGFPSIKEDRELLLRLLNDSDRSVYTKRKIKVEESKGATDAAAANMVGRFLMELTPGRMARDKATPRQLSLPDDSVLPETVPGEMDIGSETIDLAEILKKNR